jgi:uncharacterized protein YegL
MTTDKGKLLPFYLVVDVSASMSGAKLDAANRILPRVLDALADAPILGDKVRFGLVDFSDDARVVLPLCDLLERDVTLPTLTTRGATSYGAAFRLLRAEIESNVKQLKADGFAVHRPAVFFLSDGAPTDRESDWGPAFRELTGFAMFPNVVPCGVDGANPGVLRTLIHPAGGGKQMRMYLMDEGENPAEAIGMVAEVLISSILASGESMAKGSSGIMLPEGEDVPDGLRAYSAEDFV